MTLTACWVPTRRGRGCLLYTSIMPNTPVSLGAGMIQYCADGVSDDQMFAFLGAMAPAGRLRCV